MKNEGRNATIALGNNTEFYIPSWPATPRDLSEKEDYSCVLSTRYWKLCSCLPTSSEQCNALLNCTQCDLKLVYRRRGIPGFTGANPAPHQKAPGWPTPEDPSSTFAINACDARRPWTSGVRGYTGHQLPGAFVGMLPGSVGMHDSHRARICPIR